jgi:hypothetical protein
VQFDQLDAVAEGVLDMTPVASFDELVGGDFITGLHCFRDHGHEVINDKGRMRLPRRNEVFLHAQMDLQMSAFKSAAATRASCGGFTFSSRPRMPR